MPYRYSSLCINTPDFEGEGFWGASPKFKIDYQRMSNETSIAAVEEPLNPRCDREPATDHFRQSIVNCVRLLCAHCIG